jgi:hypothetical protein
MNMTKTQEEISNFFKNMGKMVVEKNRRYGNSALDPLNIFGKHTAQFPDPTMKNILVRLDEKLNRIKNASELRDNDMLDIAGYFALFFVKQGKSTEEFFEQFID